MEATYAEWYGFYEAAVAWWSCSFTADLRTVCAGTARIRGVLADLPHGRLPAADVVASGVPSVGCVGGLGPLI